MRGKENSAMNRKEEIMEDEREKSICSASDLEAAAAFMAEREEQRIGIEIMVNESLQERYPDIGAYEVVGCCMEPEIKEGQFALVSSMADLDPGRVAVFDVGRDMPRLGIVCEIVGEFVKARDNIGGSWVSLTDEVLGVVVSVV